MELLPLVPRLVLGGVMSALRLEVGVGEGVNQARTHLVLHVRIHLYLYLYLPPGHIRPMYRHRLLDVFQEMEMEMGTEGSFVNLKDQGMGVGLVVSHQRVQGLGRGREWGLEDLGSTLMGMDHSLLRGS